MQKFRFRLEALLRIRESREKDAMIALSRAQNAFQAEIDLKRKLQDEISGALSRISEIGKKPLSVNELQMEEAFVRGNRQRVLGADLRIERSRKSVAKAMRDYLMARRNRMSLDKLKEKALETYKDARDAQERKQIEDQILMRARFEKSEEAQIEEAESA